MSAKEARKMFYSPDRAFSRAEDRALARDELIYNVTEDLLVLLEKLDVSKVDLARHLGKSRAYITQLFGGSRNMTLGTLADICFSVGVEPKVIFSRDASRQAELTVHADWQNIVTPRPQLHVIKATPIRTNEQRNWHNLTAEEVA